MGNKIGKTAAGDALHYSVGAIIKRHEQYLLIDRISEPFGFAVPAGHTNEGETPEEAVKRTVREETGLKIINFKKEWEGEVVNWCSRGIGAHYWNVYNCETDGDPVLVQAKAKSIGWFSLGEIRKLKLDPAVGYWFKKIKLI